ncbi:M56 family metallopeptidase [Paenibacillus sp. IITD108]|uniref:M56 family metallopeptidase n=1 Tax=Paenibacillus sp. IITD108 TaxID=3116649 RepID=UPI002F4199E0
MKPALRINLIFIFLLVVGFIVLAQMGLYIVQQIWDIRFPVNFLQYCISAFNETTLAYNIFTFIINAIIIYTFGRMLWRFVKQIYLTRKWLGIFHSQKHIKLTKLLNAKYRKWGAKFIVVNDEKFIAMTIGLLKPQIIVSSGVIGMFSKKEFEAILLHEQYHVQNRDPLNLFLLTLLLEGMGYIPSMKTMVRSFKTWKELLADQFAMRQMGTEYHLGNVLLKVSSVGRMQHAAAAVYFAENAINYRIMQVLEPKQTLHIPILNFKPLFLTLMFTFIMSSLILGGCS